MPKEDANLEQLKNQINNKPKIIHLKLLTPKVASLMKFTTKPQPKFKLSALQKKKLIKMLLII